MATLQASLLIMGLSSIVSQIVLLREILVSFYGNELTIGIILANWLALEALGSILSGKTAEKTTRKSEVFVCLQLFFSLALPAMVVVSRVFKNLLLTTPGETVGLVPIFFASFLILLPVAVPHGALFTYGSHLYDQFNGKKPSSIGMVYLLETLGIIVGGLLMTYLLISHFNSIEITLLLSLLNTAVSVLFLWPDPHACYSVFRRNLWGFSIFLSLLCLTGLLTPGAKWMHRSSIQAQWKEMKVLHYENSIYGNIAVTQTGEQATFFSNGIPAVTTPVPDIASIEDFVHLPLLFHKQPETVLILGGGAGGMIHEILKYPVTRIDYVELDPLLLRLLLKFSTPLTRSELTDPRVTIHHADGRFYIGQTKKSYDAILIGFTAPQELQTNRFFSLEFFLAAQKKLNPEGILVLSLPGSLTYLSKELRDLNGCVWDTLKRVFPAVKVIPGDTNLFFAFQSRGPDKASTDVLIKRFNARQILTKRITPAYIEHRLQDRWSGWFSHALIERPLQINSDFHPLGVFFSLSHWNALFSPVLREVFQGFARGAAYWILAVLAAVLLFGWVLFYKKPSLAIHSVSYAILTTGLTGMIFSLLILFTFQIIYGYLYYKVGLLVTLFMAGIALGNILTTHSLDRIKRPFPLFLLMEMGIILFSLFLPFLFSSLGTWVQRGSGPFQIIFCVIALLAGSFTGIQFPLSSKIYLRDRFKRNTGRVAGFIYGADLLGGFFGGILGGVFLLPVLGLWETCWMAAALKTSSLLLCLLTARYAKMGDEDGGKEDSRGESTTNGYTNCF